MQPTELRRRRESLRLTQAQLAAYLEVSRNTITRWEAGTLTIARPHILRAMLDLAEDDPAVAALRDTAPRRGRPPKPRPDESRHPSTTH